jgi:hypothetical protein
MLRLLTPVLFSAVLIAQPVKNSADPQPPANVDKALRARVSEFLNYHVTGEFRKAEALVADDSKDVFYDRAKPRYISCKGIANIRYSDHFSKAYVTAMCVMPVLIQPTDNEQQADGQPQVPIGPPTVPLPSTWKLENGKWCWYLDKEMDRSSPFGMMPSMQMGQGMAPGSVLPMVGMPPGMTAPTPPAGLSTPQGSMMDPGMLAAIRAVHVPVTAASVGAVSPEALHHVKLDMSTITLEVGESVKVKISNDAGDSRQVMLLGQLAGIEPKLESNTIKGGESTTLNVKATAGAKSATVNLVVVDTGEMLALPVTIK